MGACRYFLFLIAALLVSPALAQQPQMTPEQATQTLNGIGAQWALQQLQTQQAQLQAQHVEIERLTKLCGNPCAPPKPAEKPKVSK